MSLTSKALQCLKKKGVPTKELKGLMNKEFHGEATFLTDMSDKIGVGGLKEHSTNIFKYASKQGRLLPEKLFTVEMPPFMQDVSDVGKGLSEGQSFTNSVNTELYISGFGKGNPKWKHRLANEAGMSSKDTDYMHIVNWKAAEKLFKAGKFSKFNGHAVLSMKDMVEANALFLLAETKSPHGEDVSTDGRYIIVSGKLDIHTTVYNFKKIKALVDSKDFAGKDPLGLAIMPQGDEKIYVYSVQRWFETTA